MEEQITFLNKNGKRLFGIVHIPEKSRSERKIGVNLLNPGIKYRVAPHRLNVKLARELCRKGYYVLRFDPEGIGDSEGELPDNTPVAEIWGKIQTGFFTQDVITANDFFIEKYGIDELVLIGNCGGAITSLLASGKDGRIDALCLIDIPVSLWSPNMSFAEKAVEGGEKANWYFTEYMKRMFRMESWYRFITLKTNYRALWKTVFTQFQKRLLPGRDNAGLPADLEALCREKKLNRLFFGSFEKAVQNDKPILFVFAGNDTGTETFQAYFQSYYLKRMAPHRYNNVPVETFIIPSANHIYTLTEWQQSLINKITCWIDIQKLRKNNSNALG